MPRATPWVCPRWSRLLRLVVLNAPTDSEDMSVWVSHLHLANTPWPVGWRTGDLETPLQTALADGVDLLHADRHPRARVGGIVTPEPTRQPDVAFQPRRQGVRRPPSEANAC
jgi:hypothetical protein